ncbi:hypothetical protein [Mesorhizobium sp. M0621]|uniref:hypothetical protein n=1 Tax=unclassified Mesorhizobium TaxID=325217 RepID=UPI003339A4B0
MAALYIADIVGFEVGRFRAKRHKTSSRGFAHPSNIAIRRRSVHGQVLTDTRNADAWAPRYSPKQSKRSFENAAAISILPDATRP